MLNFDRELLRICKKRKKRPDEIITSETIINHKIYSEFLRLFFLLSRYFKMGTLLSVPFKIRFMFF